MDPMTISAILSGFQTAVGIGQTIGGTAGLLGNQRPEYDIPDSAKRSLAFQKLRMDSDMPGYSSAQDQAALVANNAIAAAQQSGRGPAAIAGIQGQAAKQNIELASRNEAFKSRMQDQYINQLGQYASLEDRAFFYNEFGPYAEKAQESRDIFGAGLENIFGGLDIYGQMLLGDTGANSYFAQKNLIDKRNEYLTGPLIDKTDTPAISSGFEY